MCLKQKTLQIIKDLLVVERLMCFDKQKVRPDPNVVYVSEIESLQDFKQATRSARKQLWWWMVRLVAHHQSFYIYNPRPTANQRKIEKGSHRKRMRMEWGSDQWS